MGTQVRIEPVDLVRKGIRRFVMVPFRLYRGDPNWIPPLISHEIAQFMPEKNPSFDDCRARLFLAFRDGEERACGRIAAIVSDAYIERWKKRCGRFGWFESVEDPGVARALFRSAEAWLLEQGMEEASGPLGFCDNDPTGFLVEGFDQLPTIAGSYNPPYYNDFAIEAGYVKELDYVEYRITVPQSIPERIARLADEVSKRRNIRVFTARSRKELKRDWGKKAFDLLNKAYVSLYGTTPLSDRQIAFYIDNYLGNVDPEFIKLATCEDRLVGLVIAMPNLSRAFQKAGGRLFPLGFVHLLRGLKTSRVLDFYLAGVLPGYQNRGVDLLLGLEMAKSCLDRGFRYAESNREMEENRLIQAQWKAYDRKLHKRTRVYNRKLRAEQTRGMTSLDTDAGSAPDPTGSLSID
ncbi:hypothetical protein JW921_08055 [Candidatus Fermentibacterales bacterium]|nr:hypothetical protein [Candidatus Fermentibacterales bacterium]